MGFMSKELIFDCPLNLADFAHCPASVFITTYTVIDNFGFDNTNMAGDTSCDNEGVISHKHVK